MVLLGFESKIDRSQDTDERHQVVELQVSVGTLQCKYYETDIEMTS